MEALLEEPEEPEEPEDLSESVVCKKNYEEPGPRGSAAHFLLGVEMEGDPPGNENVEGGALSAVSAYCLNNINDSNKCQSSSTIDDDAVDVESAAAAVDVESAAAAVDVVDIAVDNVQDFEVSAPVDEDNVEDDLAVDEHLPVKNSKKKMPKRKHKFGKGAKRGGDRKSCRPVDPTALLVDPTALVAMERPTATAAVPVKRMNNKQLHCSLTCTMKKLICAKKKATATAKKLSAAKAQCTTLAKIARDRRKESNLAHQNAESKVNAIRDEAEQRLHVAECEIADAKELCDKAVAQAQEKIIVERVIASTNAKAKSAMTRKRHAKELLLQQRECDITIIGMKRTLRSALKRKDKMHSAVLQKQAAKSRVVFKRYKRENATSIATIKRYKTEDFTEKLSLYLPCFR